MEFKSLKFRLSLRFSFILINLVILSWFIANTRSYAVIVILLLVITIQTVNLWKIINSSIRTLSRFFSALKYDDYSQKFTHQNLGDEFRELSNALNLVVDKLQNSKRLLEQQSLYLQTVLQHVETAVLVYDAQGRINLINRAGTRLFKKNNLKNIQDISKSFPKLGEKLDDLSRSRRNLCSCVIDNQPHQLLIDLEEARVENETLYIATIQDIQSELDEKELKAWQEITRVLTHEISNSITPITSLATSCREMLKSPDEADIEDLEEAIITIERRGENLVRFINNYRKLTKPPKLNAQRTSILPLIEQIKNLFKLDLENFKIQLKVHSDVNPVIAKIDPVLIEQVLVNLINNAISALKKQTNPKIDIEVKSNKNQLKISVIDNGQGILESAQARIFVPFYTTKPSGSGIGLSLSKLIMQLHNGTISVQSELGIGTRFTLFF